VKTANFTLTADQRVHFSVVDDEVLDNRGGVSVLVQPVPEPSPTLMLVAGVVLLGFLSRPARRDVVLEQGPPRRR
jgi:hypothetical protein